MTNKGKAYDDLYLTELEQKIIDAHRNGAHVAVTYYNEENYSNVVKKLKVFGGIKRIFDLGHCVAFGNHNYSERWSVKAYIDK